MHYLKDLWHQIPWYDMARLSGLGAVFLAVGLGVMMVPLGLPGTWVIVVGGVLYSIFFQFDGGVTSAIKVNVVLVGLAVFGEIVEFGVGTLGSKPLNVSNGAIVCAFIGGIVGAIVGVPIFLIGSLIGLFIGAFLGALIYEWATLNNFGRAFVNAGAVLATRMVATFLKTTLAVGMGVYLIFKVF
ncbi:MAG: DUF456 domain-containing protein [Deltaproteobacteria bacterium]|nr:DUF456 domain-containing protein [Deltaproteobacteria bacterium]